MTSHPSDGRPRLLVLASTYPRWKGDPEPGFVHELSKRLASEFHVQVICPAAPDTLVKEVVDGVSIHRFRYAPDKLQTLINNGGITTNLRNSPWKYLLVPGFIVAMTWAAARAMRTFRPDALHAHWIIPQGFVAVVARWLSGRTIPLVVTSHGADIYAWNSGLFRRIKSLVARKAAVITVVSRAMKEEVARFDDLDTEVRVAPMGVDLEGRFVPGPAVDRLPAQILFVGRMVEKKGLQHLIDAMPLILSRIPEAKLVVAGFGPEEDERKTQAKTLGVAHAIEFMGATSQERLPSLYRRASVFVAPFVQAAGGDRDGLGLVSVEAAGCGCPVVVSHLPAVEDIFEKDEAVMVEPGDPERLAEAIHWVLRNPSMAPRPPRDVLLERFGWSSVSARYARILHEAISHA